jgi:uncharacterized membrane protein YbaN (DUF454 family)
MPRWLLLGIGFFFTGLGVLGALLPLLPATPFFLVALWAFAGSSRRFHDWLYHHPVFGPPLRAWSEQRVIPLYAKALSLSTMTASLAYVVLVKHSPTWLVVVMAVVCLAGAVFILSFPSRRP